MPTKKAVCLRLPITMTAALLSSSLMLSACSNNDSVDTEATTETKAPVAADTLDDNTKRLEDAERVEKSAVMQEEIGTETGTDDTAGQDNTANLVQSNTVADDHVDPLSNTAQQQSLVTNPTQPGTPEDTVKKALNTVYYGKAREAAKYYHVKMANFAEELEKTQSAFQKTVDGVTITDTTYNADKTRATITGELMLKGQSEPAPLTYELQKIDGQWKILG